MKRYINLIFLFSIFLYACQETEVDELFEQSPEERVAAQLEQMKKDLVDSPYGWTGYYQYANLRNENYFNIRFQNNGQAIIDYPLSDGTVGSDTTTYTLRYTQQIDLIFDTYSILASIVGNAGGDFRFEFDKREENKIYFNTRNDATEGQGVLELSRTETKDAYANLVALQAKMVDNPQKSFYRVLALDNGEKYLMNVLSLKLAWIEWTTPDTIYREKYQLNVTKDGFELETPLQAGNTIVKRFVAKEGGVFEAWSENAKVGMLDYGMKPFNYPNALNWMMNESANGYFVVQQYSQVLSGMLKDLAIHDPAFTHLQFYFGRNWFVYFRSNAATRWMIYIMKFQYAADAIGMTFNNGIGNAEANDYFDLALPTLVEFHNKSYSIVPRDGTFYFIQDQNPTIWMIIEPS